MSRSGFISIRREALADLLPESEILQTGANDVYEMTLKDSEEKVYIPAIKECIKQIDIENHRIVIHVMDGLLN